MNAQLNLFDTLRAPMVNRRVDPHGATERGDIDETLILPHPRMAWAIARIELHRDRASGLWMWATGFQAGDHGSGYRVGAKWGKFAASRDDALFYAIAELRGRLTHGTADERKILDWLGGFGL